LGIFSSFFFLYSKNHSTADITILFHWGDLRLLY
jgi:hypothetical protein